MIDKGLIILTIVCISFFIFSFIIIDKKDENNFCIKKTNYVRNYDLVCIDNYLYLKNYKTLTPYQTANPLCRCIKDK